MLAFCDIFTHHRDEHLRCSFPYCSLWCWKVLGGGVPAAPEKCQDLPYWDIPFSGLSIQSVVYDPLIKVTQLCHIFIHFPVCYLLFRAFEKSGVKLFYWSFKNVFVCLGSPTPLRNQMFIYIFLLSFTSSLSHSLSF